MSTISRSGTVPVCTSDVHTQVSQFEEEIEKEEREPDARMTNCIRPTYSVIQAGKHVPNGRSANQTAA